MSDTRLTRILGAAAVLLVALSAWLLGTRSNTPTAVAAEPATADRAREGVFVSGTGQVLGMPDVLRADFGAEARGATVDEALRKANSGLVDAVVGARGFAGRQWIHAVGGHRCAVDDGLGLSAAVADRSRRSGCAG